MRGWTRRRVLGSALRGGMATLAGPALYSSLDGKGAALAAQGAPTPAAFPVLTVAERDRRWGLARAFLKRQNLSAVYVSGGAYNYFGNVAGGDVLIPLDSPLIRFAPPPGGPGAIFSAFDEKRSGVK